MTRSAMAGASSPHKTRAGYFTPIARPARSPARIAALPLGRSWSRTQAKMAAVPKAARATSLSGADMPLDTAGTERAIAPAHQARRPRDGTRQGRHIGGEHHAQHPLDSAASDRPAKLERHRVQHLGHQRIDRLMEVGRKPDGSVHQKHFGHLKVIAQSVAVGDRRQRGECRAQRAPDPGRGEE